MLDSEAMDLQDPVVKEIPVFLSKRLANKLFVFQYPMKPACEGYDGATFIKTAIKPENQQVAIEIAIDTHDPHYSTNRGETIAAQSQSLKKDEPVFDSGLMDKVVLSSSRALPKCENYGIGIFQDGEFHITPLTGIMQLRPEFNYLDKLEKRLDGKEDELTDEQDEPAKQVNVTFARQVPDFIKRMREQSFQTHARKSLEEQWISCNYQPVNSSLAELTRFEMISNISDESINNLNLTKKQYLDSLAPPLKEEQYSKAQIPSHTSSLGYIRTLPLLDQVKILMRDAKVISFAQLRTIISTEHETASILKYLQQVAVLVQGNWIVSSELLYPKDTISAHSGIPSELMCRARDYILLTFTEQEYVDRRAISSVVKLPAEEIREIFTNIAKHQPKKGWRLVVSPSKEFVERYPEIAQRQEMFWEAKRKHLREAMEQVPQRQRRKSSRESIDNEGRGRRSLRDSSISDNDSATEGVRNKKTTSRKDSE